MNSHYRLKVCYHIIDECNVSEPNIHIIGCSINKPTFCTHVGCLSPSGLTLTCSAFLTHSKQLLLQLLTLTSTLTLAVARCYQMLIFC